MCLPMSLAHALVTKFIYVYVRIDMRNLQLRMCACDSKLLSLLLRTELFSMLYRSLYTYIQ